jgi:hypothetical protein
MHDVAGVLDRVHKYALDVRIFERQRFRKTPFSLVEPVEPNAMPKDSFRIERRDKGMDYGWDHRAYSVQSIPSKIQRRSPTIVKDKAFREDNTVRAILICETGERLPNALREAYRSAIGWKEGHR